MVSKFFDKTLSIIGGTGYVGIGIAKRALSLGIKVNIISRSANENLYPNLKANFIKGNAMNPCEFENILKESDGIVHSIGVLIDSTITKKSNQGDIGSYEHMNRETAISIGKKLEEINMNKKIVYISASKAPPFLKRYITTKFEAEKYLFELKNVKTTALRPGFIYSKSEKPWTVPVRLGVDLFSTVYKGADCIIPKKFPIRSFFENFDVDQSVELESVAISAIVSALSDEFDGEVLGNVDMNVIRKNFYENMK